ncbi:hypothetical protein CJ301_15340 [Limimaricola cinnabarinus]|uniref:Uncharacterized protein n=2 Tax=Limimaricola cinnabarinus TaxID=1125964 RepID=A0A2G1MD48_9RHOB|nr:hypothetical protein CJ301_15340 [Limimaricola cinnabarinus]
MKLSDVPDELVMTQNDLYARPTQAEIEAVMSEARQLRAAHVAGVFRAVARKLRGLTVGGKASAAA